MEIPRCMRPFIASPGVHDRVSSVGCDDGRGHVNCSRWSVEKANQWYQAHLAGGMQLHSVYGGQSARNLASRFIRSQTSTAN